MCWVWPCEKLGVWFCEKKNVKIKEDRFLFVVCVCFFEERLLLYCVEKEKKRSTPVVPLKERVNFFKGTKRDLIRQ